MSNSIAAEFGKKSNYFWTALFTILDDRKFKPVLSKEDEVHAYDLGDGFVLKGNRDRIWLVDPEGKAKCVQKNDQKDDFPYTKILNKYLKLSVLDKLS